MSKTNYADYAVEGDAAIGSAPLSNPLQVGILDVNGNMLALQNTLTFKTTAGGAAAGQAIKQWSSSGGVSINSGATVINYTVTTGKTLYVTDVDVSTDSSAAILVQLLSGSTVILEKYISTTAALEFPGIESQPTVGSGVVLTLVFPTEAGKNGAYYVGGYEM